MVQRFYNQYEEALPVIDNISDEASGVLFAVREAGLKPAAEATGKFLRFFLLESSLAQFGSALGGGKGSWSIPATRAKPPEFFLDVLAADLQSGEALAAAKSGGFAPAKFSDDEINIICLAKASLLRDGHKNISPCPPEGDEMGGAIKGLLFSIEDIQREYLKGVRNEVSGPGGSPFSVYVYGHTHKAHVEHPLAVVDPVFGDFGVTLINTGAFQRIASKEQLGRILAALKKDSPGFSVFDLRPEHLPACYTFVRIGPYSANPSPALHNWRKVDGGNAAFPGACPSD
jgi:hypothetical protein